MSLRKSHTPVSYTHLDVYKRQFLSQEIERNGLMSVNKHETIYVVSPEINNGQMLFRDNNKGAIDGKHVVLLSLIHI